MLNENIIQANDFLLQLDASEIAQLIKDKRITSYDVTKTFINHIQKVNEALNAVVEDRFEQALEEASEFDKNIDQANFSKQPFYGVPISVKESIHVNGMKTTAGIYHRKDIYKNKDALVVEQLKQAGAIVLCKTNTPPLCFCHETENKLYGRTNNGWHQERTAGGSSGGEAALISVGGIPFGLSSDIGGSIRFPSHFNGTVGFKPGRFQVDTTGHVPADKIPLKARMSSIGPIAKSVRDIEKIYPLISKMKPRRTVFKRLKVEVLPSDNGYPLSAETSHLIEKLFHLLNEEYATSYSIPPYFSESAQLWQEIMAIDGGEEIKRLAYNTDRINLWKDFTKEKLTGKTNTHPYLSWALIGANMFKPSAKRIKEIEETIDEGDRVLDSYLEDRLLVFPVYYRGALKHGELYKEIFSIQKTYLKYMPYVSYANVWGLPALTVPIGFDDNQMPIAIQIMSKIGNEDKIFRLGKVLESHFGGYVRSHYYDQ